MDFTKLEDLLNRSDCLYLQNYQQHSVQNPLTNSRYLISWRHTEYDRPSELHVTGNVDEVPGVYFTDISQYKYLVIDSEHIHYYMVYKIIADNHRLAFELVFKAELASDFEITYD